MRGHDPIGYRADIDGLRAIAVISVILFHIDQHLLPGGFVGVDIFFVISGFLISRSILEDLDRGRFSLVAFYSRRVKRIVPAMAVVVFITTLAAQLLLLPTDTVAQAKSAVWSLLSGANVYFWLFQDTGYFAADTAQVPLLHLWSLGVEEQFYLVYPVLLAAVYSKKRAALVIFGMACAALISFAVGQYTLSEHPSFAYYSLVTRIGELLIGALVAVTVRRNSIPWLSPICTQILAIVGLGLMAGSLFGLSGSSGFPGWNAAIPTVGTALVILAGCWHRTFVGACLSLKPIVYVGLISYSAYLWHWPLLAFTRYGYGEVSLTVGLLLFVLTMALAWATYLLVEQPARRTRRSTARVFMVQLVMPIGAIGALAMAIATTGGYGCRWQRPIHC